MKYRIENLGIPPAKGHYLFLSERSERLCQQIFALAGRGNFHVLVQHRIFLLQEHYQCTFDPVVRRRMEKNMAYQKALLVDPEAIYDNRKIRL